ncbi:MAG: branched-chain amino acid ABC transporter permease [Candidatus Omnitrophica bacterium]|nr:branched-chain amino acid ABC transporter permease [Candidatus Omnitrophota bacterium]
MSPGEFFLQQFINGLAIGSIYALIALGYTMVYGIIQLINFAHGEIFMAGAYLGLAAILLIGSIGPIGAAAGAAPALSLVLTILTAAAGCALLGLAVERVAYRPLRQAPKLSVLITAIGVSFFLQNAVMLSFGAQDRYVPPLLPVLHARIGSVTVTLMQGIVLAVSLMLMMGLQGIVYGTALGRAMRATAQDPLAARLMGIPVNRIIAVTFAMGSALAGVGGVLFGLTYSTINFHDGYLTGLKAFTAAVLGGIGNIPGAMLGGLLLGFLEGFAAAYLSTQWKNVVAFTVLVLVLILRPRGLLGERVAERA